MGGRKGLSEEAAVAALRPRLEALQARTHEELAALPGRSSEEVLVDGRPSKITTYRKQAEGGSIRIILQLNVNEKPFLAFIRPRRVFVQGFALDAAGFIRRLRPDEMREYSKADS